MSQKTLVKVASGIKTGKGRVRLNSDSAKHKRAMDLQRARRALVKSALVQDFAKLQDKRAKLNAKRVPLVGKFYVVTDGNGNYKFGMSDDVETRRRRIQTDCPYEIKSVFTSRKVQDSNVVESILKKHFKDNRIQYPGQRGGEWFVLTKTQVAYLKRLVGKLQRA